MSTDPTTDRPRALHLLEAADFLRGAHFRDGLSVREIGAALRHMADEADPMVGSLARDGFGLDEIAEMLATPVAAPPTGQADGGLAKHITRAIFALKTPSPGGSQHYQSGWDDGLEAAMDAARDAVLSVLPAPVDRGATDAGFVPPAAEGLPPGALDSASDGASMLDAWGRTPCGLNVLAHALVQLARDGWLRTEAGEGFEVVRDRETSEPEDPDDPSRLAAETPGPETQGGPRFVRVCTPCPECDHTVDENGACANGCRKPAVVAESGKEG